MPLNPCLSPVAFACPACEQRFSAPAEYAGRVMQCLLCWGAMTVPTPPADPNATALREPDLATTPAPRPVGNRPSAVVPWPSRPLRRD